MTFYDDFAHDMPVRCVYIIITKIDVSLHMDRRVVFEKQIVVDS